VSHQIECWRMRATVGSGVPEEIVRKVGHTTGFGRIYGRDCYRTSPDTGAGVDPTGLQARDSLRRP
jgi:hypothetical protein